MSLSPGEKVGNYEVLSLLGAGGMGEVHRAHDPRLGRDVAIKVLTEKFSRDADRLRRFEQEARATGVLNHPNILAIYDIGEHEGAPYIVSELLEGETLRAAINRGALSPRRAIDYATQIASGLAAAHDKGLVHRDLKPENIFITKDDRLKILDFGLAKLTEKNPGNQSQLATVVSEPGVLLGTVGYMSPEQVRAQGVDHRTDIFAFGAILYEMLSGVKAFHRDSAADTMSAILKEEPPEFATEGSNVPAALTRVIRRCLEKDPERRFRSTSDLGFALETLSSSSGSDRAAAAQPARRYPWRIIAGSAVLLIVAAMAAFFFGGRRAGPETLFGTDWRGDVLGGPEIAFLPRISPDGKTLAFLAMVNGLTQVGVMSPESGDWSILTRDRTRGLVGTIGWSNKGTQILFDRYLDGPRGIFTIPALGGGEERLVLPDAMSPVELPDGSLVVGKTESGNSRLFRFWPETQRLEPLNAVPSSRTFGAFVVAVPNRSEVVYYGRPSDADSDHIYLLDCASGSSRRLAPTAVIPPSGDYFPLAITPDAKWLLFDLPAGDLHRIVAARLDGSPDLLPVTTLTESPRYLDIGPDGNLYADQSYGRTEVLRFSAKDRQLDRFPLNGSSIVLHLPDGRIVFPARTGGRSRLMVMMPGEPARPLVQTREETRWPMTLLGEDRIAFMQGSENASVAIATLDGRPAGKLPNVAGDLVALAGSPDGKTLFYSVDGQVWSIPGSGGEPRKIHSGGSVAVHPGGEYLVIQDTNNALLRVSPSGESEQPIRVEEGVRLAEAPYGIGIQAINRDGRIAVRIAPKDSWYWPAGILDPKTGRVEVLSAGYDVDMAFPGWDRMGRLVTPAFYSYASIWRLRPVKR